MCSKGPPATNREGGTANRMQCALIPLRCRRRVIPGHVAGCLSLRYARLNLTLCKLENANPKKREGGRFWP
eukprot:11610750-Karenia_brevis.AAC.1